MKFTGKLKEPIIDFKTRRVTILFEPYEDFLQTYDELKGYDKLSLEIKPYRRKRSLNANSYFWSLAEKLSDKMQIPRWEIYLKCLKEYGTFEYIPLRKKDIHLAEAVYRIVIDRGAQEVTDSHGYKEELHVLQCWKGSSKYNSKEMSRLINGILEDCREAKIPESDLLTPDEKNELKEKWGVDVG